MPRDVENMPFARSAPFRADDGSTPARDGALRLENMLLEEFNYAGVTAYQALEDRVRMFNLYLLMIGVLGSALAAVYQINGGLKVYASEVVIALLAGAGGMGVAFFLKQIRLRQAWRESVLAMSLIKEYYIGEFAATDPNGARAFYWRLKTLPTGEKRASTTFVVCMTIAALGSCCFAGAALVAGVRWLPLLIADQTLSLLAAWGVALVVLLVVFGMHFRYYHRQLDRVREAVQTLCAAYRGSLNMIDLWNAMKLRPAERQKVRERLAQIEPGAAAALSEALKQAEASH